MTTEAEIRAMIDDLGDERPRVAPPSPSPPNIHIDPSEWEGRLKPIGGSQSDEFNNELIDQAARTLCAYGDPAAREKQLTASMAALAGIQPQNEIEGMVAAQMVAAHAATMECHRRAMLPEQTTEARAMNLSMANKSSRTFAALLEALNRHRGKGQQKVTVEHVHVHAGGQAVVGVVDTQGGGGDGTKNDKQPHARGVSHTSEPALRCSDEGRDAVPVASHAEQPVPNARRHVTRRPEGKPQRRQARQLHCEGEGRMARVRRDATEDAEADQDRRDDLTGAKR